MLPILKTIKSIKSAKLKVPIIASVILTFFTIALAIAGVVTVTDLLVDTNWGWLDKTIDVLVGILAGIGGWFMLPALMPLMAGIFQERVIHNVEKTDYPDKMRKKEPKLWPDLFHDIRFTIRSLLLNICILPFYLTPFGFAISILLNSYLLGREFFESAAGYHLGKPKALALGKKHRIKVYTGGLCITGLMLVPIVNLVAPLIAVIWMVHVYHSIRE